MSLSKVIVWEADEVDIVQQLFRCHPIVVVVRSFGAKLLLATKKMRKMAKVRYLVFY